MSYLKIDVDKLIDSLAIEARDFSIIFYAMLEKLRKDRPCDNCGGTGFYDDAIDADEHDCCAFCQDCNGTGVKP